MRSSASSSAWRSSGATEHNVEHEWREAFAFSNIGMSGSVVTGKDSEKDTQAHVVGAIHAAPKLIGLRALPVRGRQPQRLHQRARPTATGKRFEGSL